jgi:hypothetical protein
MASLVYDELGKDLERSTHGENIRHLLEGKTTKKLQSKQLMAQQNKSAHLSNREIQSITATPSCSVSESWTLLTTRATERSK